MTFTTRMMIPAVAFSVVIGASSLAAQEPAAPAPAQQEQPAAALSAEGELLRVDLDNKVLAIRSADTNQEQQFKFTDETEITGEQRNAEGLATMTGTKVKVEYKAEGQTAVATKIDIQARVADEPAAPAPAPAQP